MVLIPLSSSSLFTLQLYYLLTIDNLLYAILSCYALMLYYAMLSYYATLLCYALTPLMP